MLDLKQIGINFDKQVTSTGVFNTHHNEISNEVYSFVDTIATEAYNQGMSDVVGCLPKIDKPTMSKQSDWLVGWNDCLRQIQYILKDKGLISKV